MNHIHKALTQAGHIDLAEEYTKANDKTKLISDWRDWFNKFYEIEYYLPTNKEVPYEKWLAKTRKEFFSWLNTIEANLKTQAAKTKFKKGSKVKMTDDALDNYGEEYANTIFIVTDVSTSQDDHPGYDDSMQGMGLYDLKFKKDGKDFDNSLYEYELKRA